MMQDVLDRFEERVREVGLYFNLLENLSEQNVLLYFPEKKTHRYKGIESDFLKILKASSFLMIYNVIEASIRDGILAIYSEIDAQEFTYRTVRREIRDLWVKKNYRKAFDLSANWETARKIAVSLVEKAINSTPLQLDDKPFPASGSLDARNVRNLCSLHGISHRAHYQAGGGEKLKIIKDQRNALAHGALTFPECGRQFTVDDLKEIKRQAVVFVRSILRNMRKYMDKKSYAETKDGGKPRGTPINK